MKIKVSEDYTTTPGGRYIVDGEHSGENFRESILKEKYLSARKKNETLIIDMDGCYGFASSFLEEAFGGLVRELDDKHILKNIEIISNDEPGMPDRIKRYINKAYENKK